MKKILALMLLISLSAFSQTIEDARKAQGEKRHEEALRIARPLAEAGNPDAQLLMGMLYVNGQGVARNPQEGSDWLHKAAVANNRNAQAVLGTMYFRGDGVEQSYFTSLEMRKRAAEKGHIFATFEAGKMFANGQGTTKDSAQAKNYFFQVLNNYDNSPQALQVKENAKQALNVLNQQSTGSQQPSSQNPSSVTPLPKPISTNAQTTSPTDEVTRMKQELESLRLKKEIDDLKRQMADKESADINKEKAKKEIDACIYEVRQQAVMCSLGCLGRGVYTTQCNMECDDKINMRIDRCKSIR